MTIPRDPDNITAEMRQLRASAAARAAAEAAVEENEPVVFDDPAELAALPVPSPAKRKAAAGLIADFFAGRPENTGLAYRTRLEAFAAFMGHPGDLTSAVAQLLVLPKAGADGTIRRWRLAMVDEVKAGRLAPGTVNNRLTVVRSLVTSAFEANLLPFKIKIEGVTASVYRDTQGMSREDIAAMLAAPDLSEPMGRRDAAMLKLYFMVGLRVSEAINANIDSFDERGRTLKIWGKKRQSYTTIPLPEAVVKAIASHLAIDRFDAKSDTPLFVSFDPVKKEHWGVHRLTRQAVGARFKAYAAVAGLDPKDIHPHVARHSYVTQLLRAGAPLHVVSKGARHNSINTTMIYADNLGSEMQDLAELSASIYDEKLAEGEASPADRADAEPDDKA